MGYKGKQYGFKELCAELSIPLEEFVYYANNVAKHVYKKSIVKNGKHRKVYAPTDRLKTIQFRLKVLLLENYVYPSYVFGLKGDTVRDHAAKHKGVRQLVKMDLRDFFPTISHSKVYEMWVDEFGFSHELSRLLTKIITHKGNLQQGFPTSSHAAAIISKPLTQEIHRHCRKHGLVFTQYVDDLNFSGQKIDLRQAFKLVVETAHQTNFSVKRKKTRVYNNLVGREITGVSLFNIRIRAPRKVRQSAVRALKAYAKFPKEKTYRRLQGYHGRLRNHNKKEVKK
jgi:RNA-directed DNA polymerase